MTAKSQKKEIKKLTDAVEECRISTQMMEQESNEIVLSDVFDPVLVSQWPKPKMKVPAIFLHKTGDFAQHAKKLLMLGINFYQPYLGTNYTKISCLSFNDHRAMMQYFDKNHLSYHTFGHPSKRKMRVVIKGLPKDLDLPKLLQALKSIGIPIIRVHKMNTKKFSKARDSLVLAVVPYTDDGKKLLQLKTVFGHEVTLEHPYPKTRHCHLCQKWGHSQRYCHGEVKCVKCAGDHYTRKCTRDPEKEPPTCANCGGNHTASYRECFYCPDSTEYKRNLKNKIARSTHTSHEERVLVNLKNLDTLYKKVQNIPKHKQAVPF